MDGWLCRGEPRVSVAGLRIAAQQSFSASQFLCISELLEAEELMSFDGALEEV